ncbi:hypothetical protein PDESU_01809 [Pontiella desulfatans]|uniref:Uncharacterized protein n=1 Tax=Pontiella desulfatans TaxID=2750659 RepID=A0A6C2U062_PONDE|nr:hypothetical protein [Pontiella desulfatans]VGO13253.1 hypothetical protein PDESU_01809 [Pontiella desulfatans]
MKRTYAGLTDHPRRERIGHGNPSDWTIVKEFHAKAQARLWLQRMKEAGCETDKEVPDWGWGFTYTLPRVGQKREGRSG